MSKKPETLFKEKIAPLLKALPRSWWLKTQLVAIRGIPDYLGCVNGHFVALELKKSARDNPDALQGWVLEKITQAGGLALKCDPENFEQIYAVLIQMATAKIMVRTPNRKAKQDSGH